MVTASDHADVVGISVLILALAAEWLHQRRWQRLGRLAFGPGGEPAPWIVALPWLRAGAVAALAWGLMVLCFGKPQTARIATLPEGGYRHLVIALDVSPSMQLKDAGLDGQISRARRASELLMSLLERIPLDQVRISVVAFFTGAKPVVVDTFDLDVVKNILNDLPLDMAFDIGKTSLISGVKESAQIAKAWQPGSAVLVVVSDGDTVPDSGLSEMPVAIEQVIVIGVGDSRSGRYIDGHQSRQDQGALRQLAGRLRGAYFDGNQKHLPSQALQSLSRILPLKDDTRKGRRELALAAVGLGAGLLGLLPVALAFCGRAWHSSVKVKQVSGRVTGAPMATAKTAL
jgi:Ca-activated chloride channel family protein